MVTAVAACNGPPADPSGPFEGPEKLLELWFQPASLPSSTASLRSVDRDRWQTILNTVSCTILSVLRSDECDAYLLSESSMFVFDHKLILKTCGTTTLLLGLEHILHLAHGILGGGSSIVNGDDASLQSSSAAAPHARLGARLVDRIFYSRKSFMFPDRQKGPHRDWMLEVALLDDFFSDGAAYTVGKMNGDHWLLYMASQAGSSSSSSNNSSPLASSSSASHAQQQLPPSIAQHLHSDNNEDQTLEILMTHLHPSATRAFYYPPLDEQAAAAAQEEDAEKKLQPNGTHPATISATNTFQQATLKGGAASPDEPLEDDEDADPGSLHQHPNGSVGHAVNGAPEQAEQDKGHSLGALTSSSIGLAALFTGAPHQIDAFAFEPCGYSANALISASSPSAKVKHTSGYWTVHVTPEPECSYASFETNVRFLAGSAADAAGTAGTADQAATPHNLTSLIKRVIGIFQPGKMSITLFLSSASATEDSAAVPDRADTHALINGNGPTKPAAAAATAETNAMALDALVLKGYRRTDRILYEFEGYDLTFVTFERVGLVRPSKR
ncbi:spermidine resistance protein [Tilletia horrida]|uniref:Spermidine resistance protein n=1 Tax=Tilletia horrida TaxID=155126 RepID=A0AAN6GNE9_9BASI|nr:spermidine resistance protein [Tilletia horrida]KAK0561416.1 spermidine resistance protein [Tilletia horrida]